MGREEIDTIIPVMEACRANGLRLKGPLPADTAFNPQVHKDLVSGLADKQYSELFEVLADESSYPLVYHCSHGVHRTGTATALLLSALNVPWETVREDYLLSNVTRESEVSPRIEQLEGLAADLPMSDDEREANSKAIRAFYILQPERVRH